MKRLNIIIGIGSEEEKQIEGTKKFFNKTIEEKFPNLQKDIFNTVQELQKIQSPCHNNQSTKCKEQTKDIIAARKEDQVKYRYSGKRKGMDLGR